MIPICFYVTRKKKRKLLVYCLSKGVKSSKPVKYAVNVRVVYKKWM